MEPQEAQNEESSLTSRVRELEKENEELKAKFQRFAEANQWDALKIVEGFEKEQSLTSRVHELGKENDALKEELKRRYERDIWSDNHSRTEIFMERDKYMEENRRLREALEVIAKPSIGWDGSSNEMRQIARQALKDARAAIDQAAKKEGE